MNSRQIKAGYEDHSKFIVHRKTIFRCEARWILVSHEEDSKLGIPRRVYRYQRGIKICKSKDRQHNGQKKKEKGTGQTTIYKTLHRKLKIEQHEPR